MVLRPWSICSGAPESPHPFVVAVRCGSRITGDIMYHFPLRASAAIASGVALVSMFGAASPALAKGSHHESAAPTSAAATPAVPAAPAATPAVPAAPAAAPATPAVPAPPAVPAAPATPAVPADPATPAVPADPATPAVPADPATPAVPADPATPAVPAAPAPFDCLTDPATVAMTATDMAVNPVGDAGCVAVRVTPGTVRLAWVVPPEGWTYVVERNGGGTNDRVELRFTQAETNAKLDFRYERGKTSIG